MTVLEPRKHTYIECNCKKADCVICNKKSQYCSVCDCQDNELLTFCPGHSVGREAKSEIAAGTKIVDMFSFFLCREGIL